MIKKTVLEAIIQGVNLQRLVSVFSLLDAVFYEAIFSVSSTSSFWRCLTVTIYLSYAHSVVHSNSANPRTWEIIVKGWYVCCFFPSQDEDAEADREELATGDWISISVEIERWNLLVCQLSDLQALTGFIGNLATGSSKEKQGVNNSGSPGLSVVGTNVIIFKIRIWLDFGRNEKA